MGEISSVTEVKKHTSSLQSKQGVSPLPITQPTENLETKAEDTKKLSSVRSRLLGLFRRAPKEIVHQPVENASSISIQYEEDEGRTPFFTVDSDKLQQALIASDYSKSIFCPLIINQGREGKGHTMAHYNSVTKRLEVFEQVTLNLLKRMQEREHAYIDGERMSDTEILLERRKFLLNPLTTPYALLRDEGAIKDFSGNDERKKMYMQAAQQGFVVKKDGETIRLSPEESKARAKAMMDKLIERAAPYMIGWVIAHEYEHRDKVGIKLATKLGASIGPFLLSVGFMQAANASHQVMEFGLAGGVLTTIIGSIFSRRYDEKKSYDKADAYYQNFAKAVSINSSLFTEELAKGRGAEKEE